MFETRQAHGKLDDSLLITFLASHRLFLNIFGGNKIQNGQIAWFIGYTIIIAFDRLCGTPAESKLVFIRSFSDGLMLAIYSTD